VVQGYQIEWSKRPFQIYPAITSVSSVEDSKLVDEEVKSLFQKKAITVVSPCREQFISRLFLVRKKDGSYRPVINLKPLNAFVQKSHFKMEGLSMIRDLLQPGDWMCSLDLKDAYLSVSIAQEDRKYLRFLWDGRIFEFTCLPFGLCSAPRTFTKLLRPVMAHIRSRGVRTIIYLDDILIMHQSRASLLQEVVKVTNLLMTLGFTVNYGKSQTSPTQQLQFLGFLVDSRLMKLFLPQEKIADITQVCADFLKQQSLTIRQLSQLLGKMTAATPAVLSAPVRFRHLQQLRINSFKKFESFNRLVTLNEKTMEELRWWKNQLTAWNGKDIILPAPTLVIETDASLRGWGAVCGGVRTGGLWSQLEQQKHINVLELTAGMFAVQAFVKDKRDIHVHLRMDNTSALAYVTRMGGTRSPQLIQVACQLWDWCLQRGVTLSASHLPGLSNVVADFESREVRTSAEWKLHEDVFRFICSTLGACEVDLFATRLNNQLSAYISWTPDPGAMETDAFQVNWMNLKGYAFPPFSLVGRCLQKIRVEGSTITLIAPLWKNQAWYPMLLEMMVDLPLLLPHQENLLRDPMGQHHPLVCQGSLRLIAWRVSGNSTQQSEFLTRLQSYSWQVGAEVQIRPTSLDGTDGWAGVREGRLIPFHAGSNLS